MVRGRRAGARPRVTIGLVALAVAASLLLAGCGAGGSSGTPAAAGAPTASEPTYKITVAGDSISVGLGASLRTAEADRSVVKVIGEAGTGLARPDRFDWPARLAKLAREFPPNVLVLSLSSNDAQDLTDATGSVVARAGDAKAWDAEYTRRLAAAIEPFRTTGTTVVWVGHVRTAEDRVGLTNRHIQTLAASLADGRPFLRVADLAQLLGTGEAKADRCLIADGLHLSVACLDEAAGRLREQLPAH